MPRISGIAPNVEAFFPGPAPSPVSNRVAQTAHRGALESLAPPSMLVDAAFHAVHLSETAGRYFMPSGGPFTADVADLVRPELRFELRAALHRAFEHGETTLSSAISVRFNGKPVRVYMHIKPVQETEGERSRALILFVEGEEHEPFTPSDGTPESNRDAVLSLKQELDLAHTRLRTMREESEAANEELRAANEELQSINEEYRSTAEELETSKEELQSINEELQTVNSELKLKLESVSRANSDLQNLMAASDFATLFLDPGMHIKRFTPKLAELFNITPVDVGRPITDFTHQLDYEGLTDDAGKVLANLMPIEREIRSRNDGWYLVRFRPYRTVDDKIDGVVATFIDVTERKRMEDALRTSEQKLLQEIRLVDQSNQPTFVWDFATGAITQWNKGCERVYGYSKNDAVGKDVEALLKPSASGKSFSSLKKTLEKTRAWSGVISHTSKNRKVVKTNSNLELLSAEGSRFVLESGWAID